MSFYHRIISTRKHFSKLYLKCNLNKPQCPFKYSKSSTHFLAFDFNENTDTPLHDIDPDIQFYSDKYSLHSCDYYLEGTFNDRILQNNVKDDNFSMLHANIRSAQKNLASLEQYNNNFDPGLKNTILIDMVLKVIMVFIHYDRLTLAEECLYLCRTLSSILCEKISPIWILIWKQFSLKSTKNK